MAEVIDKILASVLQKKLKSITQEMAITLLRTTRSPILHEARDFVTGLYDSKGRMLEQTEYIPILAFSLQPVCEYIIDYYGSDIYPGDVIIHNDVYTRGNQNADVAVFKPVFFEGKLVAWSASKGHQADIGGAVAGSYNPNAREVWQEALRIPPVKIYEKGKLRRDVWDLIFANIRFEIVKADIQAQIGACNVGEREVLKIFGQLGAAQTLAHIEYLFDAAEKMVRAEIKAIPNGTYRGQSRVNYDGVREGSTALIKVAITVSEEKIVFDYTGTDPQTPGFVNAPLGASASATILAFLMLIDPDIPHNCGILRPLDMIVPTGTILNPRFPAATTFGNHLSDQIIESIFSAMAEAIPEKITAAWNRCLGCVVVGHDRRKRTPYADILFIASKGGSGGTYGANGYDHIGPSFGGGGVVSQDYEMFELEDPHLLIKHEYLKDSPGAGRWRGGFGVETIFEFRGENTMAVYYGDGVDEGAPGIFGGKQGAPNYACLVYPDGRKIIPRTKDVIRDIPEGTIFIKHAGGGGGYGDPLARPLEDVLEEVRGGLLSAEKALIDYAVVIDPQTLLLDEEKTSSERQKQLLQRPG